MLKKTKIAIIGAGAAGIASASRLLQKGINDFVILEANNRIGGRIHTVNFADNVVDLGAQWVHGESGNVVFNLASKHDLLASFSKIYDPSTHMFITIKGETLPKEESTKGLLTYFGIIEREPEQLKKENGSFGDYFIKEFYKIFNEEPFMNRTRVTSFLDWVEKMENSIECSDTWFEVSAKRLAEYWHCEGDPVLNWKDQGYKTIFDLLLGKIPDVNESLPVMQRIEFEKIVTNINYNNGDNVIITTKDGCKYCASHVIFTASLGVLKEKHLTMFMPPLSQKKQRAIKGLNIGTANKIFLQFSRRWWPDDITAFNIIWSEEDKLEFLRSYGQNCEWLCDVFSFFIVEYQPNVLCAWIVGKNARHMETLSETEVVDGLYLLLNKSLGKRYDIIKPDKMLRSKWHTNEYFRGSYTFQSILTENLDVQLKDLAEPIMNGNKPIILFAGEATHDHYYSTVHGAVETGYREADRLADFERNFVRLNHLVNDFNKLGQTKKATNGRIERTKIVIVGAGIAGLAAAKTLQDAGFMDYLLLEAQDKVGGRIHSISWDDNWIDCGAQFLHGDKSELAQYCLDNNLLSDIQGNDGEGIFLKNDGMIINKSLICEIDDFVRTVLEECENQDFQGILENHKNIGSILKNKFKQYLCKCNDSLIQRKIKEEIFDWNVRFLLIDNSCQSLNDLSATMWGKFKYVGGPEHLLFKSSYSSLTNLLFNNLNMQKVRLATAVKSIYWKKNISFQEDPAILVTTSDGAQIFSDSIIITCSLGYLKENYKRMFQPSLPERLEMAIKNLGFGLINKIFLDFGKPWWHASMKGFQFLFNEDSDQLLPEWTRDLTGFDVLPNHQGVLIGWIGGKGAYIIESLSKEVIMQDCMNLLKHYLQSHYNIPSIRRLVRTKWNENKYVRGGYSHITKNCEVNKVMPSTLAEPICATILQNNAKHNVPIIMFAGEATHDNFYSTTHGAYETGIHQAEVFLHHYASSM